MCVFKVGGGRIGRDYERVETLHRIIEELDVARIQVFVQAIIVEVSAERARDIGVSFQSATNISGSTIGVGQLNFGQLQTALANPLGLTGLGIGLASGSKCTISTAVTAAASVVVDCGSPDAEGGPAAPGSGKPA